MGNWRMTQNTISESSVGFETAKGTEIHHLIRPIVAEISSA